MKCPYCNREMEEGVIQSSQEISWNKERHLMAKAEFYEKAVLLAEFSLKGAALVSYICRDCKKVIIDYEAEHDLNKMKKEAFWKKRVK